MKFYFFSTFAMGKDCFCCSLSNLYCRPSTKAKTKQAKKILKNPKYKKLYWRAKRILAHKSTPEVFRIVLRIFLRIFLGNIFFKLGKRILFDQLEKHLPPRRREDLLGRFMGAKCG